MLISRRMQVIHPIESTKIGFFSSSDDDDQLFIVIRREINVLYQCNHHGTSSRL